MEEKKKELNAATKKINEEQKALQEEKKQRDEEVKSVEEKKKLLQEGSGGCAMGVSASKARRIRRKASKRAQLPESEGCLD